jgi:hypothetical protein
MKSHDIHEEVPEYLKSPIGISFRSILCNTVRVVPNTVAICKGAGASIEGGCNCLDGLGRGGTHREPICAISNLNTQNRLTGIRLFVSGAKLLPLVVIILHTLQPRFCVQSPYAARTQLERREVLLRFAKSHNP